MRLGVRARRGRLAEVQSERRGREKKGEWSGKANKSKLYIVLRCKNFCAAFALLAAHQSNSAVSSHMGAEAPARRKALLHVTGGRCVCVHSLGTNSNQVESSLGLLVTRTEISLHQNALLFPSELYLFSTNYSSPGVHGAALVQWRWIKAQVFIMRASRKKKKKKKEQ